MTKFIISVSGILVFLMITSFALSQPDIENTEKEIVLLTKKLDLLKQISKLDLKLKADVDLAPVLAKLDAQIVLLKSIDAKLTQLPNPPIPPVPPTPITGKVVVDVTFIGQRTSLSADATMLKWLKDNNVAAYELISATPSFKESIDKVGLPCVVLRDKDKVIIDAIQNPSDSGLKTLIQKHLPQKTSMLTPLDTNIIRDTYVRSHPLITLSNNTKSLEILMKS